MTTATSTNGELLRAHLRVKQWICDRIGHDWSPGSRLPPIARLAEELEVGRATAFRAVRELVAEGVLVSAPKLGTFVSKGRPRAMAIQGKRALLFSCVRQVDPFVKWMVDGFVAAFAEQGGAVEMAEMGAADSGASITQRMRSIPRSRADAIVLFNGPSNVGAVADPDQLLVCINTAADVRVAMPGRYDVVSVEHDQGAMLAGKRLRDVGCTRACFVGVGVHDENGSTYDSSSAARLKGFERGWGAAIAPEHRLATRYYAPAEGAVAMARWLHLDPRKRPEGIFAATDELAIGFAIGAVAHGLKAGQDFRIIGFDGQQAARDLLGGPLTTVAVPAEEMGRLGAQLLISRFEQPDRAVRRVNLGCSLLEGTTA